MTLKRDLISENEVLKKENRELEERCSKALIQKQIKEYDMQNIIYENMALKEFYTKYKKLCKIYRKAIKLACIQLAELLENNVCFSYSTGQFMDIKISDKNIRYAVNRFIKEAKGEII